MAERLLSDDRRVKRVAVLWALTGFCVGALWIWLAFAYFTSKGIPTLDFIGYLTCPPLLLAPEPVDLLLVPSLNGVLYGVLALLWLTRRSRGQPRGAA